MTARHAIGIFVFLLITALSVNVGFTCTCMAPRTVEEALSKSSAVFRGKVVEIYRPMLDRIGIGNSGAYRVKFQVVKRWRGPRTKHITVTTKLHGEACGYPFKEGGEYLVYVIDQPELNVETGICTGTKDIADAASEIKELNRLIE